MLATLGAARSTEERTTCFEILDHALNTVHEKIINTSGQCVTFNSHTKPSPVTLART